MNDNETTADITAEMRDEGHTGESSCLEWVGTKMRYYADRLEAAHKRERGDVAKLREAALAIRADILKRRSENCWYATDSDILEKIDAALAASPRNCDVGTVEEQSERFYAYCKAHKDNNAECLYCPLFGQTGGHCELVWAQMPYVEKGGDGR